MSVSNYGATKRFTAEALIKMMNISNGGRSILPEDAEGWVLGPGTGTGPAAINENTQSLTHHFWCQVSSTPTIHSEHTNNTEIELETYLKYFQLGMFQISIVNYRWAKFPHISSGHAALGFI
jgi:hypothetical protein